MLGKNLFTEVKTVDDWEGGGANCWRGGVTHEHLTVDLFNVESKRTRVSLIRQQIGRTSATYLLCYV